jgi:hypothetical protein
VHVAPWYTSRYVVWGRKLMMVSSLSGIDGVFFESVCSVGNGLHLRRNQQWAAHTPLTIL